jgi:catechol 2,3-dioxygenase-like lactoylglutathione lyase family enzyme
MSLLAIHHVQLAMPEGCEDQARGFYRDLLGLLEVEKPANLAARGGCWFEQEGVRVHLGVEQDFAPARKAHSAFLVTDLAALVARLSAAGCPVIEDQPLVGYDRCYVADPFGNRIELMQHRDR